MTLPLLAIEGLSVAFPGDGGPVEVVRDVGLEIGDGEFVGLVGESGSGKSLTALAALQLVPHPGRLQAGSVRFRGQELVGASEKRLRRIRGGGIGLVFQEPGSALNPVLTIGFQIVEAIRAHHDVSRSEARRRAAELLERVAMPSPESRLDDYPHQLSGGQRQRAMIALALAAGPDLLIADEPTTALDVTVQAQILELLADLRRDLGLAVLLITHDLAVVAETCERVLVMYAGTLVESAPVAALFESPAHPYTRGLLASVPVLGQRVERGRLPSIPGRVPTPNDRPRGCAFHPRCPEVFEPCDGDEPALQTVGPSRSARCYLWP